MITITRPVNKYGIDGLENITVPHKNTMEGGYLTIEATTNEVRLLEEYMKVINSKLSTGRMDDVVVADTTFDISRLGEYKNMARSYTFKNCTVDVGTPTTRLSDMEFIKCKVTADFSKYTAQSLGNVVFDDCEVSNVDIGGMSYISFRFKNMTIPDLKSTPLSTTLPKNAHTNHSTVFSACTIGNSDHTINLYTTAIFAGTNTLIGDLSPVCGVSGTVPKGKGILNLGLSAYIAGKVNNGATQLEFTEETCKIGFAPLQNLLNVLDSSFRATLPDTLLTPYINAHQENDELNININNSSGGGFILNVKRFHNNKSTVVRKVNMTVTGNSDTVDFCLAKDETIGYEETPPTVNVISNNPMLDITTSGDASYQFNTFRFRHKMEVGDTALDGFNSDIKQSKSDGTTNEYLLFKHKIKHLVNQHTQNPQIVKNIMNIASDMMDKTDIRLSDVDESKVGGFYKTLQMTLKLFKSTVL